MGNQVKEYRTKPTQEWWLRSAAVVVLFISNRQRLGLVDRNILAWAFGLVLLLVLALSFRGNNREAQTSYKILTDCGLLAIAGDIAFHSQDPSLLIALVVLLVVPILSHISDWANPSNRDIFDKASQKSDEGAPKS